SRRRQTRSKRDWSSDVCSSDLPPVRFLGSVQSSSEYSLMIESVCHSLVSFSGSNSGRGVESVTFVSSLEPSPSVPSSADSLDERSEERRVGEGAHGPVATGRWW